MLWKSYTQYTSKFGKLSSGHRTGKGQFSFQSLRKAMPKNAETTTQLHSSQFNSIAQLCLFVTAWTAAHQASLSITNSQSPAKPMSIKSVMPSNHLMLCCPLLLLSPIPPSIRIFSNESTLHMKWPKYWSFSFSINPSTLLPWKCTVFIQGKPKFL